MLPSVLISKTDGNLGVATNTDRILAIIGTAAEGEENVAFGFTNKADVGEEYTSGPLYEAAAYAIALGIPVVAIRATPTTAGDYGTISSTLVGTATVAEGSTEPDGDYDVVIEILADGALGTAGIFYRYSMNGGEDWSVALDLGTSLTLTVEGGVSFTLSSAASTLKAGDTWSVTTTAPQLASGDLTDAFTALTEYAGEWLRLLVVAQLDDTALSACDVFAKSFHVDGRFPEVITNTRVRGADETRAEYQAALTAVVSEVQSTEVSAAADQCEVISQISGRRMRMLTAIPYAARTMIIDDSRDAARKSDGALPGVFVTNSAGERVYHDERLYPGLDALGLTTLRTWGGRPISPGAYITNPRLLAGAGSDYRYFQHTAIINRIIESGFSILQPKLSIEVLLGADGKIREDVATAIEEACSAELRTRYSDPGRVSNVKLRLSRNDNVLSTDTITFNVDAQPLAYLKKFIGKAGLVRLLPTT